MKKFLKGAQTGVFRLTSRKLFILASLITLILCFAFITCGDIPEENDVTDVIFDRTSISIPSGNFDYLTFTVQPAGAVYERVDWKSDNTEIVEVNNGIIKAKKQDTTNVQVTIGKVTKVCSIKVGSEQTGTRVDSVSLNKTTATLTVGNNETLTATVAPSNAANKEVFYISSDPKIAAVDSGSGKVTGKSEGNATITVYTKNLGKTATCAVTVKAASSGSGDKPVDKPDEIPVESVSISPASLTLLIGDTANLTPLVLPTNASNRKIKSWISDKKDIAEVSLLSGQVLAKAAGTATITVTTEDGDKTGTCTVKVLSGITAGIYKGTYRGNDSKDYIETVELSSKRFYIYDNFAEGDKLEFLDFTITKWDDAQPPSGYQTSYLYGYKLTGKITGANPKNTNNLYGSNGAPNFSDTDINNTECWIYIYIDKDGKFIRSLFSKASGTDNKNPVSSTAVRIYSKPAS